MAVTRYCAPDGYSTVELERVIDGGVKTTTYFGISNPTEATLAISRSDQKKARRSLTVSRARQLMHYLCPRMRRQLVIASISIRLNA